MSVPSHEVNSGTGADNNAARAAAECAYALKDFFQLTRSGSSAGETG